MPFILEETTMSGGSLNYFQWKDVDELLADSSDDENLIAAGKQLAEYGELGAQAKDSTETITKLLVDMRDRHKREREELESCITPALRQVWRQLDFQGSNDVSKDDVRQALVAYNEEQAAL